MRWDVSEVRGNGLSEAGCCLHRLQALAGQDIQEGHALWAQQYRKLTMIGFPINSIARYVMCFQYKMVEDIDQYKSI